MDAAAVVSLLRRVPFTVVGFVCLLAVAAATGTLISSVGDADWLPQVAYGLPSLEAGRWWTPASGTVFAYSAIGVALVFALFVGFAELRMGTVRTIAAFVAGQLFGVLAAAGFLAVARGHGWLWADSTATVIDIGCSAGAMAALGAATATLHAPWRGRFRFVLAMYCVVALLYVGRLWDVEHALALALGLAAGPLLLGRRPQPPSLTFGRREWRLLAAGSTLFAALGSVAGALFPGAGPLGDPRHEADPAGLGVLGVLVVTALILLSDGLRRGRRVAWRWVVGIAAAVVVWAVLPPYTADSVYTGLLAGGLVVVLLVGRDAFTARGDTAAGRRVWVLLGLGLLALALYAVAGFTLISGFNPEPTLVLAVEEFVGRIFAEPGIIDPSTTLAGLFLDSLTLVWWAFLLAGLLLVLWSNSLPGDRGDRDGAVTLLRRHGGANLSWMITWPDNAYWFSADGEAVVAYRVHAGVVVGLCDPVGPPDRLAATLREFASFAEEHGWSCCLFSVTQHVADAADTMGWRALQVAEEAVVPLPELAFTGKKWQDVRTAINRAKKEGVVFELGRLSDIPYTTVRKVRAISEQWVAEKGLPEMGFTLGGVDEALDPEVRVGLAVRDDSTVDGVTSWLPVLAPGGDVVGWTLDVMRRRDGGFRPVTEFLIASACLAFQSEGAGLVSLSGAPLAHASDDDEGNALERVLDTVGEAMEPMYGFRSLHQFKAKFQPVYAPMYLVYPDEAALPRIGLAIGRAYLPQGFSTVLMHR